MTSNTNTNTDTSTDYGQPVHLLPAELAKRHRTSVGHLANLRSRGKGVPYLRVGRSVLYPMAEVVAYETGRTVGSQAAA